MSFRNGEYGEPRKFARSGLNLSTAVGASMTIKVDVKKNTVTFSDSIGTSVTNPIFTQNPVPVVFAFELFYENDEIEIEFF